MSRRWLILIGILGLSIPLAVARLNATNERDQLSGQEQLTVSGLLISSESLNEGDLWAGSIQTTRLTVTNTTGRATSVHGFDTSCDCVSATPSVFTVGPGASQDLELRIDTTPTKPWLVGLESYVKEYTLRPNVSVRFGAREWVLRRTVRSPITTDLPGVHFGESNRKGSPPVSRTMRIWTQIPGTPTASLEPPVALLDLVKADEPHRWLLKVTPRADLEPGRFAGELRISFADPTSLPTGYSLQLPVNGVMGEVTK